MSNKENLKIKSFIHLKRQGLSSRSNTAIAEMALIDAMVRADGWRLEQFVEAPLWLQQIYSRHATVAYRETQKNGGKAQSGCSVIHPCQRQHPLIISRQNPAI